MNIEVPKIYVKEGDDIVEKEAPLVERECWWCKNPFMWEVARPMVWYDKEMTYYQCCSCGAKQDMWDKLFQVGIGERK